jgi:hypothetical protein
VTVTKIGFGVWTGVELLLDVEFEKVGVEIEIEDDEDDELLVYAELELVAAGAGAASTTVVVTSCVTVGPGLTASTVFVGLTTVVACRTSVDPPSTLMTE